MDWQQISDATGFDNGNKFSSSRDVYDYFTIENMVVMFGDDFRSDLWTERDLRAMAEAVIANQWNME